MTAEFAIARDYILDRFGCYMISYKDTIETGPMCVYNGIIKAVAKISWITEEKYTAASLKRTTAINVTGDQMKMDEYTKTVKSDLAQKNHHLYTPGTLKQLDDSTVDDESVKSIISEHKRIANATELSIIAKTLRICIQIFRCQIVENEVKKYLREFSRQPDENNYTVTDPEIYGKEDDPMVNLQIINDPTKPGVVCRYASAVSAQ